MLASPATKEVKHQIVKDFGKNEEDSGSTAVQIALLTNRINYLQAHFRENKKDNHSRRGLIRMVENRKKLLTYLKSRNSEQYTVLLKRLNLRK